MIGVATKQALSNSKTSRALAIILAVAIVVRIGAALYLGDRVEPLPGTFDQLIYDTLARRIMSGYGYSYAEYHYPFIPANTPTAYCSFLYPLYLVPIYSVFGYHPLIARIVQAVVGAFLCLLTYRLGRRLFDERTGLVAAIVTGLYIFFVYYSAALMTQTFFMLALLLVFDITYSLAAHPTRWKWIVLGVTSGFAILLRQTMMPFVLLFLAWLWWDGRGKVKWQDLLIPIVIIALFILPWTIRNYLVFGRFLLLNSEAGHVIWNSNHPEQGTHFDPGYVVPIPEKWRGWNEVDINNAMLREGIGFILQDPTRFVRLSLSRIPVFFEFWPKADSPLISNISRTLSFGVTLPFMLVGLILSLRRWRRYLLLYLFILGYTAIHLVSWASARYRLPMDAVLILFAGYAMVQIAERLGWMARAPDAGDLSEGGIKTQGDLAAQDAG